MIKKNFFQSGIESTASKQWVPFLFALILGLSWLVYFYTTGLSFSADSGYYLSYALGMHNAGDYFVHAVRPPLYPLLIHLFMYIKQSPGEAAALVSGVSLTFLMFTFALILQKFSKEIILNCLTILSLFTFTHFTHVFGSVMSEVPFALFFLLSVYFLIRHYETGELKFYTLTALSVALASLSRYMGYAFIAVFFLYTVYYIFSCHDKKKYVWLKYMALNSISYLPIALFVVRNFLLTKTAHGYRETAKDSIFDNLHQIFFVLGQDFSLFFLFLLAFSFVFFLILTKQVKKELFKHIVISLAVVFLLVFFYVTMLAYTTSNAKVDPISSRYFSPIYPLFFLFIIMAFNGIIIYFQKKETHFYNSIFKKTVPIVLYSFIIATIFIHTGALVKFLNKIYSNKYSETCSVLTAGYNISYVPQNLANYFNDAFQKEKRLFVSAIYETNHGFNYPHLGQLLFFRDKTFEHPHFSHYSFQRVSPNSYLKPSNGFTISITTSNKEEKKLVFWNLPKMKAGKKLFLRIAAMMRSAKIKALHLIINSDNEGKTLKIADNFLEFLPKSLLLLDKHKVGPYYIFKLGL